MANEIYYRAADGDREIVFSFFPEMITWIYEGRKTVLINYNQVIESKFMFIIEMNKIPLIVNL